MICEQAPIIALLMLKNSSLGQQMRVIVLLEQLSRWAFPHRPTSDISLTLAYPFKSTNMRDSNVHAVLPLVIIWHCISMSVCSVVIAALS